ncbi:unnamed protein product [Clonostachys rosea f. rosea IK726]|uniref:Uncharacterized protein n=1 Tax=Clonostachys rosea f. rosea IK726 TaxID=1349383 RepID=A0ACA9TE09_BIOOC|nr:unnamed protein product [Clonostachys rosea f. rosea IK726]
MLTADFNPLVPGTPEQPASMTLSTLEINQGSDYPIIGDSSTSLHIYATEIGPVPTPVSSGYPDVSIESATVIVTDTTTEITQK